VPFTSFVPTVIQSHNLLEFQWLNQLYNVCDSLRRSPLLSDAVLIISRMYVAVF